MSKLSLSTIRKFLYLLKQYSYNDSCVWYSFASFNVTMVRFKLSFEAVVTRVLPAFGVYPVLPPVAYL